jgi:hypothetical protein
LIPVAGFKQRLQRCVNLTAPAWWMDNSLENSYGSNPDSSYSNALVLLCYLEYIEHSRAKISTLGGMQNQHEILGEVNVRPNSNLIQVAVIQLKAEKSF